MVDELQRESVVLCRYLMGEAPTEYVTTKYCEGVRVRNLRPAEGNKSDRLFMSMATRLPVLMKVIDAYTSLFDKTSLFRMKLVLMLAILESSAPMHTRLDTTDTDSKLRVIFKTGYQACFFALSALCGFILFTPVRLFSLKYSE